LRPRAGGFIVHDPFVDQLLDDLGHVDGKQFRGGSCLLRVMFWTWRDTSCGRYLFLADFRDYRLVGRIASVAGGPTRGGGSGR